MSRAILPGLIAIVQHLTFRNASNHAGHPAHFLFGSVRICHHDVAVGQVFWNRRHHCQQVAKPFHFPNSFDHSLRLEPFDRMQTDQACLGATRDFYSHLVDNIAVFVPYGQRAAMTSSTTQPTGFVTSSDSPMTGNATTV